MRNDLLMRCPVVAWVALALALSPRGAQAQALPGVPEALALARQADAQRRAALGRWQGQFCILEQPYTPKTANADAVPHDPDQIGVTLVAFGANGDETRSKVVTAAVAAGEINYEGLYERQSTADTAMQTSFTSEGSRVVRGDPKQVPRAWAGTLATYLGMPKHAEEMLAKAIDNPTAVRAKVGAGPDGQALLTVADDLSEYVFDASRGYALLSGERKWPRGGLLPTTRHDYSDHREVVPGVWLPATTRYTVHMVLAATPERAEARGTTLKMLIQAKEVSLGPVPLPDDAVAACPPGGTVLDRFAGQTIGVGFTRGDLSAAVKQFRAIFGPKP